MVYVKPPLEKYNQQLAKKTSDYNTYLAINRPNIRCCEGFVTALTRIEHECIQCGRRWKCKPNSIKNGTGCRDCKYKANGKALRKSHSQYVKDVFELVGNEYKVLGEYSVNHKKIKHLHVKCGRTFNTAPGNFLTGSRCRACGKGHVLHTYQEYDLWLQENRPEIKRLDDYKGSLTSIKHSINGCPHKYFYSSPANIKIGMGCKKCHVDSVRHTDKEYKAWLKYNNPNIEVLEKYKGSDIRILHNNKNCNHKPWLVKPNAIKSQGQGCPDCGKIASASANRFAKKLKIIKGKTYKLQGWDSNGILYAIKHFNKNVKNIHSGTHQVPVISYRFYKYYNKYTITRSKRITRKYYPDVFIDTHNILIEVKSAWTFNSSLTIILKNWAKFKACIEQNYRIIFLIYSKEADNPVVLDSNNPEWKKPKFKDFLRYALA